MRYFGKLKPPRCRLLSSLLRTNKKLAMRYLLLIIKVMPYGSTIRLKSRHPETGASRRLHKNASGTCWSIAGNATDQPDTGNLKHPVKPFADTAADNGIGVQLFIISIRLDGAYIKSHLPPLTSVCLVIDDPQTGAGIQHR